MLNQFNHDFDIKPILTLFPLLLTHWYYKRSTFHTKENV